MVLLEHCTRFNENKVLLHPDSAVPDGDEGDAKEEAEDTTDLGDHGRGRVKELLSFKGLFTYYVSRRRGGRGYGKC